MKKLTPVTRVNELTIEDLVLYERASRLVCQKYENSLRQYDGSIAQNTEEYHKFESMNNIHLSILGEMENRLNGLK